MNEMVGIVRHSFDPNQTIEQAFAGYVSAVYPAGVIEVQEFETRQAFFGGVAWFMSVLSLIAEKPENEVHKILDSIQEQLDDYGRARRHQLAEMLRVREEEKKRGGT